jgi:3-hydroxyisobutyrate dehydrogenase
MSGADGSSRGSAPLPRVAVVGLGRMGRLIARRLLEAGHEVAVWNRTAARTDALVALGARPATTPAAAARDSDILISLVADPVALRAVSGGSQGIAAGAHARLTVIEMSTVGPAAIAELRATLPPETALLDAPVLGSVAEAEAGTLTILVGGAGADVRRARPVLDELGQVVAVGPLGSGAAAKLVANAALFGAIALLGETIALGRDLGLADDAVYQVLAETPLADQAKRRRPAIDAGDYPARFALSMAVKDGDLILQAAEAAGRELRLIEVARRWLRDAESAGAGSCDYTAVLAAIVAQGADASPSDASARAEAGPQRARARDPLAGLAVDGLIVDLDGVVWLGGQPIDGAVDALATLRARGTRLMFLTNDPTSSRAEQAARLQSIGVAATADDVMTSAAATARFLAEREDLRSRPLLLIGSPAFEDELAEAGFELVRPAEANLARLVVVGAHSGFDFAELRAATRAVAAGAHLVAAGRDRFVPTADGPEPATGAVLAAVEAATGVEATVVGKPEPYMFELAHEMLVGCERVAVVGDNLTSDIAGAKRAGLDAILVLTGAATLADVEVAEHQPDMVLARLAELPAKTSHLVSPSQPRQAP